MAFFCLLFFSFNRMCVCVWRMRAMKFDSAQFGSFGKLFFFFSGGMNSSFKNGLGQLGSFLLFFFFCSVKSLKAGSARYWRCDQQYYCFITMVILVTVVVEVVIVVVILAVLLQQQGAAWSLKKNKKSTFVSQTLVKNEQMESNGFLNNVSRHSGFAIVYSDRFRQKP